MIKLKVILVILIGVFILAINPANADPPDVTTIIKKMDEALNAWRSGTRKLLITLRDGDEITNEWTARNAYKEFPDGKRSLLVILEPKALKGSAHLFWNRSDNTTGEWQYFPSIRRVRKLTGLTAYDSFFGTDFTYADLGIKDPGGTHKLLGEEMHEGIKAYKVETIPQEDCYYSRIINWIAYDTFLPIQRDYYDAGGRLWKTKLFENVITIDNIPKPLRVRMLDLQRDHSTEVTISEVCYDVECLPKETFNPKKLSQAVFSPVCTINRLKQP
jgi:hypothetical protein